MEKTIKQLFVDFIENRCSAAEMERVRDLLRQGNYEREWREAMEKTEPRLADKELLTIPIREDRLFERIQRSAGIKSAPAKVYNWISYAAVILLFGAFGLLFLKSPVLKAVPEAAQLKNKE